ncbi:MAG: beta-hydroxyacyl-ACP dehydratase [Verrucomicrobiaceae bacterium]|nr:beta-hydroxyacyl-ACP dehydratase [Verrucomicrobiaceae bacterium]
MESLTPGTEGTAVWILSGAEHYFRGHFPDQPLVPGVLMVESIAQLAGIVVQSARLENPLLNVRLTAIRQFKIGGTVPPPATLRVHARIDGSMGGLIQASGTVTDMATGNLLATGAIVLSGKEPTA